MSIISKLRPIINNIKQYKKNIIVRAKFYYTSNRERLPIEENSIVFESFNGNDFTGSPFYMLLEACNNQEYSKYKKYVVAQKAKITRITELLKNYSLLDKVSVVERNSKEYCRLLIQGNYFVNNVTFPTYFVKKEGQVMLNTWHGTPLKGLGRNIKDNPNTIGNVQRNFLMSDYLLYPNRYSYEHIKHDYMLDNFYNGKYVLSGYPCNSVFFDKERAAEIKEQLNVSDKKVVMYMPTWRSKPAGAKTNKHIHYIVHFLNELDNRLDDDTIVFAKLHHLASGNVDYSDFKRIRPFPENYETYDILNASDCLITDYSSVMFDYLNTGKEILLYTYDKDEYMAGRSIYYDTDDLPFKAFDTPKDLCEHINSDLLDSDYSKLRDVICEFDNKNSSKVALDLLLNGKQSDNMQIIEGSSLHNGKENVLIFAGELAKNGLTTALLGLINNIDADKRNYVLTFYTTKTEKYKDVINTFKENIYYIPIQGAKNLTYIEAICQYLYFKLNIKSSFIEKNIERDSVREAMRCYPGIKFDYVIHYTGYERHLVHILNGVEGATKCIYTHNDLLKERKTRNNIHINSLKKAYRDYDKIILIRDSMKEEVKRNIPNVDPNKFVVAHNFNNIESIIEKSKKELCFDNDTYCNISIEQVKQILSDKSSIKFIDIARYSPEKGLDSLVFAFNEFRKNNPNSYLFIIGGHGNDFAKIKELVGDSFNNIIIIRSISNPHPILVECDCFVLSSHYEGLPMTIMEALILGKKVISTAIAGPKEFLEQGYGYLVEDSVEGLVSGMNEYAKNQLSFLKEFDAERFNQKAEEEFNRIFD